MGEEELLNPELSRSDEDDVDEKSDEFPTAEIHVLFFEDRIDVSFKNWDKIGARRMERAYRAISREKRRLKKLVLRERRLGDVG